MIKSPLKEPERDKYPLYCLSFSPNWNTNQIVSVNAKGKLAYGSNSELFIIDILNKDFVTSVKPEENIKHSQFKVSAVLLDETYVYAGFTSGSVYSFNHKLNNEILYSLKISKNPIMQIVRVRISEEKSHMLFIDAEGIIYDIISLEGIHKSITLKINCDGPAIRVWPYYGLEIPILIILNAKGNLVIWNFEKEKEIFKSESKNVIYAADIIDLGNGKIKIGAITKKDNYLVFTANLMALLQGKQDKETFDFHITKLQFQIDSKYKSDLEVLNARGHTLFLDNNNVIISGKVGEIYIIPLTKIQEAATLALRHLSAELGDEIPYTVAERNEHYKPLYSITKFYNPETKKTLVMTLGIDRRFSLWQYQAQESDIDFIKLWDISFLGGKILKIITSDLEKNKLFLYCGDKTFRIWDLEKKVFSSIGFNYRIINSLPKMCGNK